MSAYITSMTPMTDEECLLAALAELGFDRSKVEVHANPVALLSARRLGDALAELKEQADYILCDAPPVLAVTDAALWAAKVDGVVLLVNAGGTKRDQALQARQILERVHAHIVGAVLLNAERNTAMLGYEG